jgi:DNA (cytosine-5)-methyltransferase 1
VKYLSVCSGIEAATVAWHRFGWEPIAFSEIEAFPAAVLAHHYPSVPNWGDMTAFKEWPDADVDVLVGGTPCQSFSVAGLRKGLDDPRGNLMLTYLAIAARYRPRWLVWENVPGVLSSNGGRDFGSFLGGLGELGYGFAYRVLDAQHLRTPGFPRAVPQRRRRVFVVGYLGDWTRAAAVLFEPEGMCGHPPPRREAGQVAPTVPSRSSAGGGLRTDFDCDGGLIASTVASTLNAAFGSKQGLEDQHVNQGCPLYVAIQERAVSENPDAGPDGKGFRTDGAAYTIEARTVPQAVAMSFGAQMSVPQVDVEVNQTLQAKNPMAVALSSAVRRLVPEECEALQGFPDGYTRIPYRKKTADACPDGPRYKALGNSMATNCMEFIGERIAAVEDMA